jgi:(S)-ureidoglycine aminohydrolase
MNPTELLLSTSVAILDLFSLFSFSERKKLNHSCTVGNSIRQASSSYPSPAREERRCITYPNFLFFHLIFEFLFKTYQPLRIFSSRLIKQGLCAAPLSFGEGLGVRSVLKRLLTIFLVIPLFSFAQQDSVLSGAYSWKEPVIQKNKISSTVLLEGKVHDFEWMQVNANTLAGKKNIKQIIPSNQEQLIIIKSGTCNIKINDSVFTLTPGSVAVLMPGQKYSLKKNSNDDCKFFTMSYLSKQPMNFQRGTNSFARTAGNSFVKIWENIPYKTNSIGGSRRDFFERPTAIQKRFEMHVTTLQEGRKSHEPHTHRTEEIVLIIDGETEMQLGDGIVKTTIGGFFYLGSNVSHAIKNIGTKPATYFAFQFE